MPYVQRDTFGKIVGRFANPQRGIADEWLPDNHADLQPCPTTAERTWRDAQLASTDYAAMPDYPLTEDARAELYAYRQDLRDWPQSEAFPNQADRPQPPEWLTWQIPEFEL